MPSITISDAASGFADLIHRVMNAREDVLVTEGGVPVAKVVPMDEIRTGRELALKWANIHHLDPAEAESMEADLMTARKSLSVPHSKWD